MLFLLQISLKIKVSIRFRYKKQGSFWHYLKDLEGIKYEIVYNKPEGEVV